MVCDILGTLTMGQIAKSDTSQMDLMSQNIHGITGFLAIVLMLFHALWETWVLYKCDDNKKRAFHKFSITVWVVWLIPYIIGMVMGMRG